MYTPNPAHLASWDAAEGALTCCCLAGLSESAVQLPLDCGDSQIQTRGSCVRFIPGTSSYDSQTLTVSTDSYAAPLSLDCLPDDITKLITKINAAVFRDEASKESQKGSLSIPASS